MLNSEFLYRACLFKQGLNFSFRPSSFIKGALAESVINAFPCLKDPDAPLGYVSMKTWYILLFIECLLLVWTFSHCVSNSLLAFEFYIQYFE